jgi:NADH-quinone oxidoreductase subunit N
LAVVFLGSAGIPPFLGFFTKLSVISILISSSEYLLAVFGIVGGYFSAYFYWQLLRFLDYQPNKFTYKQDILTIKNSSFFFLIYILIFSNVFAYIFFADYLIFTNYLAILI